MKSDELKEWSRQLREKRKSLAEQYNTLKAEYVDLTKLYERHSEWSALHKKPSTQL